MICSVESCELPVFKDSEKCILHCKKPIDDSHYKNFLNERNEFYSALLNYINQENKENTENIYFQNIHFPRPDYQGQNNYLELLKNINQIDFHYCHFYSDSLNLDNEIYFQDCKFHNNWYLYNYKVLDNADDVIYQNCIFNKKVRFNEGGEEIKELSYSQFDYLCEFKDSLVIDNASIKKNIFNTNQPHNVNESQSLKAITFTNCDFTNSQEWFLPSIESCDILLKECSLNEKFKIANIEQNDSKEKKDDYEDRQKRKAKLSSLKIIDCTASENAYLRIGFLDVNKFELKNLRNPQNAELNIGDCHFKNFTLSNFRNIGKFKLFKINTFKKDGIGETQNNENFQIDNTSIGDADFQSVNLSSFSTVKMFDNILVGLKYTNIKWGEFGNKKEVDVDQFHGDTTFKLEKQQDTYRTLKNVASSNNDQPQAIQFYAKEMENHYALVPRSDFSTKITLWFNKWSNGFGLSWGWQLLFLIAFASVMYCFLLLSIDIDYHQLENCESEDNILGNFVNFINPIHSTEFIFKDSWNNLTYTIDFIFRIIEGLMLYQIIQAFRKYTRKL